MFYSLFLQSRPCRARAAIGLGLEGVQSGTEPTIERTTVSLSAIFAVCGMVSLRTMPGLGVFATPKGSRYSAGASGFGFQLSWATPPAILSDLDDVFGGAFDRFIILLGGLQLEHLSLGTGRALPVT
jgi:hypothetical protein